MLQQNTLAQKTMSGQFRELMGNPGIISSLVIIVVSILVFLVCNGLWARVSV